MFIQNILELFLLKYGCTYCVFYSDKKSSFKSPVSNFLIKVNLSRFSTFRQLLKPFISREHGWLVGWMVGVAQSIMYNVGDRREKIGAREGRSR